MKLSIDMANHLNGAESIPYGRTPGVTEVLLTEQETRITALLVNMAENFSYLEEIANLP